MVKDLTGVVKDLSGGSLGDYFLEREAFKPAPWESGIEVGDICA